MFIQCPKIFILLLTKGMIILTVLPANTHTHNMKSNVILNLVVEMLSIFSVLGKPSSSKTVSILSAHSKIPLKGQGNSFLS